MRNKYLLDTQSLLWFANNPDELGRAAYRLIVSAVWVGYSPISIAELEVKRMIGKIRRSSELESLLFEEEIFELPFAAAHAKELARFGTLVKHDPFDRLIVAQAAAEKCHLITADQKLLDLGFDWILDARE